MAVVKSWKDRFENKDTVVRVRFSAKTGEFSITLQQKIVDKLGMGSCVSAKTLEDVEKKYWKTIKAYKEAKTTRRKVIAYKVEAQVYIHRVKEGVFFKRKDISFADGCGLTVYAEVAIEETHHHTKGEKHLSYESVEDTLLPCGMCNGDHGIANQFGRIDEDIHVIDWTLEREKWFAHIGFQLENMVMNVSETLGHEDTDVALQLIDSGHMLMAPKKPAESVKKSKKRSKKKSKNSQNS